VSRRGIPRAWQAKSPRYHVATVDEQKEARLAAARVAVMCGWCTSCGVTVDEKAGKLHDPWCSDVPPERRMPK
jgi:hypothetical protein